MLLPTVRELDPDELIITDGFSCREQIEQSTDRTPLHIAQLLAQAIETRNARTESRYR